MIQTLAKAQATFDRGGNFEAQKTPQPLTAIILSQMCDMYAVLSISFEFLRLTQILPTSTFRQISLNYQFLLL